MSRPDHEGLPGAGVANDATGEGERHFVAGDEILGKVKALVHEGNVRHIVIDNGAGRPLIEVPVSMGVEGGVPAPVWAAVGALTALSTHWSIEVERDGVNGAPS